MAKSFIRIFVFLLASCFLTNTGMVSAAAISSEIINDASLSFASEALSESATQFTDYIGTEESPKITASQLAKQAKSPREWTNPYEWLSFAPWEEVEPHLRATNGSRHLSNLIWNVRLRGGAVSTVEFQLKLLEAFPRSPTLSALINRKLRVQFDVMDFFFGVLPIPPLVLEDFHRLRHDFLRSARPLTIKRYISQTPGSTKEEAESRIAEWLNAGLVVQTPVGSHGTQGFKETNKGVVLRGLLQIYNSIPAAKKDLAALPVWRPPALFEQKQEIPPAHQPDLPDRSDDASIREDLLQQTKQYSSRGLAHGLKALLPNLATHVHTKAAQRAHEINRIIVLRIPPFIAEAFLKEAGKEKTIKQFIPFLATELKRDKDLWPPRVQRAFRKEKFKKGYIMATLSSLKEIILMKKSEGVSARQHYAIIKVDSPTAIPATSALRTRQSA